MPMADVQIQVLDATALDDYRQHLLRLDGQTRHARFGWAMDDAGINAHCLRLASESPVVIGGYIDDVLRAGLELWPAGRCGEIVFSVETDWRRKGFGTALIEQALAVAKQQGMTSIEVDIDEFGPSAVSLVRKFSTGGSRDDGRVSIAVPQAA